MISIREANSDDNEGLLALTKRTPMSGVISLCIDRNPDFFHLLRIRGDGKVFIATVNNHIIGCVSVAFRDVFVNGELQKLGYLADLKIHPSYRKGLILLKLFKCLLDYAKTQKATLYFCVVADKNEVAFSALRGRGGMPRFESIGKFFVYQIVPSFSRPRNNEYIIEQAKMHDIEEICQFVNTFNASYQLAPLVTEAELCSAPASATGGYSRQLLVARKEKTIVATLSVCDMSGVKQNVVIDMPGPLRIGVSVLQFARKIVPLFTFPKIEEPLRMLYLRNLAFKDKHERALQALLQCSRNEAFRKQYTFVNVGIHESDPLRFLVRGVLKYTFVAHGLIGNPYNDDALLQQVLPGIPMEDFALV
jgi:N-acetylglutamate synthase-like GNAT family acetyltransferase